MNISNIRNHKFLTILTMGFLIWLLFLLMLLMNKREVHFYDALNQIDVSSSYSSIFPFSRYIVEPFFAIAQILEMEFTWIFLYLFIYPFIRIGFKMYLKKNGKNPKKLTIIISFFKNIINFCFKVLGSAILIVLGIILIGLIIQGFYFINRFFMVPIHIAVYSGVSLIIIKFLYNILRLFHPNLKLKYRKYLLSKGKREQKKKKTAIIKKELMYYIGIGFLLISGNIILISTQFPTHKIVPTSLDNDEFLVDLHVHTIFSDGWLTPEERVNWYIEQGISIAAFSDHDNLRGARIAKEFVEENELDFTVLIAEEWTDHENDIHMNYYGLNEELVPLESYTPGGPLALNTSDLINYVRSKGGYVTVNHYNYDNNLQYGGFGVPYTLEQLRDWGVDGFEIVNGGSHQKYLQIRQFCLDNNLICMGGSDIHTNEDLNTFVRIRLSEPENKTVAHIFETLKDNTHQVVAIDLSSNNFDFLDDLNDFGFYIIEDFLNYIININPFQVGSWIFWSSVFFTFIFIIYTKIRRLEL